MGGGRWTRGKSLEGRIALGPQYQAYLQCLVMSEKAKGLSVCAHHVFYGPVGRDLSSLLLTIATLDLCLSPAASLLTKQMDQPFSEVGLPCMVVQVEHCTG